MNVQIELELVKCHCLPRIHVYKHQGSTIDKYFECYIESLLYRAPYVTIQ